MLATYGATHTDGLSSEGVGEEPITIAEPELVRFLSYWEDLAGSTGWPGRRDLDPVDIPRLLPHLMITQPTGDGGERVRLIGTHITEHLGFDPTGACLAAYAETHGFAQVCRYIADTMHAAQAPLYAGGRQTTATGAQRCYRRVVCPLKDGDADVGAMVSCIVFTGESGNCAVADGRTATCDFVDAIPFGAWRTPDA